MSNDATRPARLPSSAALRDSAGNAVRLGQRLGSGGEAEVFAIVDDDSVVAKIYKMQGPNRERKLRGMVENPPSDPTLASGHRSICWPETLLYDRGGTFSGFLMSRIDFSTSRPLLAFYNPLSRQRISTEITWQYLVRIAVHVSSVMEAIHFQGHVIGDVNESNFLVSNSALVTLVDCDSIQINDKAQKAPHRCPVGKPEFTPPELQGRDFSRLDREPAHDHFALAVTVFLLLMEGVHPFMGSWSGYGNAPPINENIKDGRFPYMSSGVLSPSPVAPPFELLPADIRELFLRCFCIGHDSAASRPSAAEWQYELKRLDAALQVCHVNGRHVFSGHLPRCPWCVRTEKLRGFDPYPAHAPVELPAPKPVVPRKLQPVAAVAAAPPRKLARRSMFSDLAVGVCVLLVGMAAGLGGLWFYFHRTAAADATAQIVATPEATVPEKPAISGKRGSADPSKTRRNRRPKADDEVTIPSFDNVRVIGAVPNELVPAPAAAPVIHEVAAPVQSAPKLQKAIYAAKHKHRLGGCDGVLTLDSDVLVFESHDHPLKFSINDVQLDDDGITDGSGKNWHFSIKDVDVRQLLRKWKEGGLFR